MKLNKPPINFVKIIWTHSLKKLIIISLVVLVCFSCKQQVSPLVIDPPTSLPIEPTKQITHISLPLAEKWRWSGFINNTTGLPMVVIVNDRVIVAINEALTEKVMVFDAHSGDVIWESGDIRNLRSIHADENRVYVGSIRSVRAYDLVTGQEVWEGAQQPSFKRGRLNVYPESNQLNVYDPYDHWLYILDSKTGRTIEKIQRAIFFKQGKVYYLTTCGATAKQCLIAEDIRTAQKLWLHDLEGSIYSWPVIADGNIFLNTGGQLIAIRIRTGEIAWQTTTSNFVTPMALGGETLYAVRDDAAIVGFDSETGRQTGVIEIAPSQSLEYTGGYVPYYTIAASDEFLAVYYSNSEELIVFQKTDPVE